MKPYTRETIIDRRQQRISWGAVFAGAAVAVGLWVLLQMFGVGVGLSAIDTDNAGNIKGVSIGTGVWSLIAPIIAMFIGGLIAGRLAGSRDMKVGGVHGLVMWSLTSLLGVMAIISMTTALASGALKVGGAAAGAAGDAIGAAGGVNGSDAMKALDIDVNDLLGPINQQLQAQGKPPVSADQLQRTARAVAQRSLRTGSVDRNVIVEELARNTSLSRADAEDIADRTAVQWNALEQRVRDTADQAKHVALEATQTVGQVMLGGALMFLLALLASVGGAMLGVRGEQRRDRGDYATTTATQP